MSKLRIAARGGKHAGREFEIEFDPAKPPAGGHGRPGSILDVALHAGVEIEHACGGNCACTTCHVIVKDGMRNLSDMEDPEADKLDTAPGLTPTSRLACQAVAKGDVSVEIPLHTVNLVAEGP